MKGAAEQRRYAWGAKLGAQKASGWLCGIEQHPTALLKSWLGPLVLHWPLGAPVMSVPHSARFSSRLTPKGGGSGVEEALMRLAGLGA